MALPKNLRHGFAPAEIEFLAENEPITVIPSQRMETLQLINGSYGPFRPPLKNLVPLWLARTLKRKHKCNIVPPEWMDVDYLKAKLEQEMSQIEFSAMPFRYMEIAHILLGCASDDIPQAETARTLLKDLREARQSKVRSGLKDLDPHYLQIDNLGVMEINEIRPFFSRAFNELRVLTPAGGAMGGDSQTTMSGAQSSMG
ncbi:DNA replication protein psf2 [Geranomyces variabilis]|uniref:DNA replication complex GINS protein PSF2 n=1 Tax=Geranomyces variabilis TaxID=109894 RepID=A0AAD5TEN9_9FUNG|nr:DNA replication protein psf2 [Geranomyces variabilis]